MAINLLLLVVGLLVLTGSLAHARRSIGMYDGSNGYSGGYRGRDNDYSSKAYGSTEPYYTGGEYDNQYVANSEESEKSYRGAEKEDYWYPPNLEKRYRDRDEGQDEQVYRGYYDYSVRSGRRNPGYPDWDVSERSYFNQESEIESHKSHDGPPSDSDNPPPSDDAPPSDSDNSPPSDNAPPSDNNPPSDNVSPSGNAPPSDNVPPTDPSPGGSPPAVPAGTSGNPIDDCWRHDPNWSNNRQALANCAIGFGKNAIGGAQGPIYVVTDNTDDDLVNPKEGTLRYAVLQDGPLWIGFARDMTIVLTNELIMTSYKTIDGRGFDVHIAGGAGLTLQYISHVIVHGVHIHDLRPSGPAVIRSNSTHSGHRQGSDGDAVNIFGSHDVWVDHCYFARGTDGLVDAIMGSTFVSVTNNFFEQHDKVMLFGAHPFDTMDNDMQISVAFNHFGPGLIERVPRLRHGHAHVFNNYYASWGEYAIGGSESPTILSEGNIFNAPDSRDKQVTKRIDDGDASFQNCMEWDWQSVGDKFLNGAYFVAGGSAPGSAVYSKAVSTNRIVPAEVVPDVTKDAGPLVCPPNGGLC